MTLEEYNQYKDRLDWADWLKGLLMKALEGTGLRPSVEYIPAEYEEKNDENGETVRVEKMPEMYSLTITLPLEWRVINRLAGDDICAEKALEITRLVVKFFREAWPDRMVTDHQYDIFRRLPGFFDWLTEKTPEILWKLTMIRMCETIGKRNVRNIDLYEDKLIIHTRRGSWRIDYDNYRDRLEEVVKFMRPWMRKPIRYQYLRSLRNRKKENDSDNDNKNKG